MGRMNGKTCVGWVEAWNPTPAWVMLFYMPVGLFANPSLILPTEDESSSSLSF